VTFGLFTRHGWDRLMGADTGTAAGPRPDGGEKP